MYSDRFATRGTNKMNQYGVWKPRTPRHCDLGQSMLTSCVDDQSVYVQNDHHHGFGNISVLTKKGKLSCDTVLCM